MLRSPPHRGADRNTGQPNPYSTTLVAPSQGRGSKHLTDREDRKRVGSPPHRGADRNNKAERIAGLARSRPLTGARIETRVSTSKCERSIGVAPSQGRGSKPLERMVITTMRASPPHRGADRNMEDVVEAAFDGCRPLTGARNETVWVRFSSTITGSRPLTGARIETRSSRTRPKTTGVAPSQGRGSKRPMLGAEALEDRVAPSQGRGSKLRKTADRPDGGASPPHRGADRNIVLAPHSASNVWSPPQRGADRNPPRPGLSLARACRPLTGARIETCSSWCCSSGYWSPPHRGADRNLFVHPTEFERAPSPPHRGASVRGRRDRRSAADARRQR